jgi:hypothetical protein
MTEPTMDEATTADTGKSWWDDLGEFFDHIGDEIIDTAEVVWKDVKDAWDDMKASFLAMFERREKDENGRPVGEGFWGRAFSFVASVIDFAAQVLVILAEVYLLIYVGGFILRMLAAAVIAMVLAALAVAVGIMAYKAATGIALLLRTPNTAYYDRDRADENWAQYKRSWKPRYWLCWSVKDMPAWDEFWEQVDKAAAEMKDEWDSAAQNLREEDLWKNATAAA